MRILLDECVNPRLRRLFPADSVLTVAEAGWLALPDNLLLQQAQDLADVFITIDRGFAHQHNLAKLSFGVVIIHVAKNSMAYYEPLFDEIRRAVYSVGPGQLLTVR